MTISNCLFLYRPNKYVYVYVYVNSKSCYPLLYIISDFTATALPLINLGFKGVIPFLLIFFYKYLIPSKSN